MKTNRKKYLALIGIRKTKPMATGRHLRMLHFLVGFLSIFVLGQTAQAIHIEGPGTQASRWADYRLDSLLIDAVRNGNLMQVRLLVDLGANPNGSPDQPAEPLLAALRLGNDSVLRSLVAVGANPDLLAANGQTPLAFAIRKGMLSAVSVLLSTGAQVNTTDRLGRNYLMLAVEANQYRIVKTLLKAGADAGMRDARGETVFDHLQQSPVHDARLDSLFDQLAESPFLMVRFGQYRLLLDLLRQHPEEIYRIDEDGNSVYHYAVLFDKPELLELLPNDSIMSQATNDRGHRPADLRAAKANMLLPADLTLAEAQWYVQTEHDQQTQTLLAQFDTAAARALGQNGPRPIPPLPPLPMPLFFSLLVASLRPQKTT